MAKVSVVWPKRRPIDWVYSRVWRQRGGAEAWLRNGGGALIGDGFISIAVNGLLP